MRTILRPFAIHAAYSPIETIVFFCTIGTLAYFQILYAIKHSSFLAPAHPTSLRPAHAALKQGDWVPVRDSAWFHAKSELVTPLELQQIVLSLDSAYKSRDGTYDAISMDMTPIAQSTLNFTSYITHNFYSTNGRKFGNLCHRPEVSQLNHSLDGLTAGAPCFTEQTPSSRSFVQTLTFAPGARDEFISSLTRQSKFTADEAGVRFEVESKPIEPIGQMRSSKWIAYAVRALVMRFWDLAKKADSFDILLILAGYILMHYTFIRLFSRSRQLGSNFWLPCAIISSAVLALLVSLPIAMWLRISMDPVALTEALPFLVCTVGFDKPLRLARAVFSHPHLTTPVGGVTTNGQLKPAGKIITECLDNVYIPIIRDYILEIAVLVVGANSKVAGLREVCALAALLLAVDCLLLCTYLSSVLCIMIEVRRIQTVRAKTRSRSSSFVNQTPPSSIRQSGQSTPEVPSLRRKISSMLLGVKGSSVQASSKRQENPVARLKLLLIASFLTLHILNLCTPLGPTRPTNHTLNVRKVEFTSPAIRTVLSSLAETVKISDIESEADTELLVKISPPVHIRVIPPTSLLTSQPSTPRTTSSVLEDLLSAWTHLVGDPILSKWIVVVLAISISLNGYLLKGIAAGLGGKNPNARNAVRFSGESQDQVDDAEAETSPISTAVDVRGASPVPTSPPRRVIELRSSEPARRETPPQAHSPAPAATAVPTFTLDDVDRRLNDRRLTMISRSQPNVPVPPSSSSDSSLDDTDGQQQVETIRSLEECIDIFDNGPRPLSFSLSLLNDEEVILLAQNGKIAAYALEKVLGPSELERAVRVRRALISRASPTQSLESSDIPMSNYDYSRVLGACCENVVGYVPLPLGIAGPLKVDGQLYHIPMATAEGTLVASTSRGCKALNAGGGVTTVLTQDAMTRGPAIDFPSIVTAAEAKAWIASEDGYAIIKDAFESTSRFAKLRDLKTAMAGRTLFVRFATATGDAMGMNMISKGTEKALEVMQKQFPEMVVLALSGNYCTDKKAAAINWIEGRGKSIVAEAVIPGKVVKSVLKTTVEALCNLNVKKNLVGSAMAGSLGGFNAHAANILTAVFLATGQDPAQNVVSSNCMTLMESTNNGEDLLMTVSMPSIEVGTIGGGTVLAPQGAVLEFLGIKGAHPTNPGQNAQQLARIIASAVMAGELSLMSALAAGHLVRAHLVHNRSQTNTPAASVPATPGGGVAAGGQVSSTGTGGQVGGGVNGERKEEETKVVKSLRYANALTPSSSTGSLPPYSQ
ncbi:hypothetical protein BDN72DRAFT_402708 [Pluteus cervinus]|uniref:Uncharacterized protein n=1 Tax=Pluteus cervinus TaxID=181527 RepID=A0ACD3B2T6_9AGAR|nr:hypothetical protein BDN72DRAFT_402708 [Pluteus cervinus]